MRICRFAREGKEQSGYYFEEFVLPLHAASDLYEEHTHKAVRGRAKGVRESDALRYVAGYTVVNDFSDRGFRPNPGRTKREKDSFFDWQHGKWHDGFCPMGPCVLSADAVKNPQEFDLELQVNGETRQDSSTSRQIFPVAAVIEFISSFVTLEPGDIISTGTPAGVGNTTKTYLRAGDKIRASIAGIGVLENQIVG